MSCTLAATIALTSATDNGDGTFTAAFTRTVTGGTAPYSSLWAFSAPAGVDPLALNCPTGQTTASVTLTLPFAPYAAAGLNPLSGQTPPTWLNVSCTVTDTNFVPPPVVSFTVSAPTAAQGASVTETWAVTGATSVTIDNVTKATSGSETFVPFP